MAKRKPQRQQPEQPRVHPRGSSFSSLRYSEYMWGDDGEECPTRSPELAAELINHCPEAASALEVTCAYALSSGTGDEMGFVVELDPNNPQPGTVAIASDVLSRCFTLIDYWQIIWRMLAWGDAFVLMDIDTKQRQVVGCKLLPTWQIHRMEDDFGVLSGFEQRWARNKVYIPALSMVQWSYNKRHRYGRSLYHEARRDWAKMKEGDEDLSVASRSSAIQPNLHIMPPGVDENYRRAYKEDHGARRKQGLIPDFYLLQGAEMRKPAGIPSSFPLNGLIDYVNLRRLRIAARSRVPLYLLGIDQKYASEIAMQAAIAFVMHVGAVRQLLAQGLRQVINTELALQGVPAPWHYRITFPKINVNPWAAAIDEEVDQPGVEDVDG
ncbi:MAG: hypothetical protein HC881_18585 [Leptolyngbyaceae cyanobacterium SL_7_1]|nr:hypothetical protein [Leptolyngbyaceae cyanobacterium SL_7_1]